MEAVLSDHRPKGSGSVNFMKVVIARREHHVVIGTLDQVTFPVYHTNRVHLIMYSLFVLGICSVILQFNHPVNAIIGQCILFLFYGQLILCLPAHYIYVSRIRRLMSEIRYSYNMHIFQFFKIFYIKTIFKILNMLLILQRTFKCQSFDQILSFRFYIYLILLKLNRQNSIFLFFFSFYGVIRVKKGWIIFNFRYKVFF